MKKKYKKQIKLLKKVVETAETVPDLNLYELGVKDGIKFTIRMLEGK